MYIEWAHFVNTPDSSNQFIHLKSVQIFAEMKLPFKSSFIVLMIIAIVLLLINISKLAVERIGFFMQILMVFLNGILNLSF